MRLRGDFLKDKRGQLAIFIIVAVVILGAVALFFFARGSVGISSVPQEIQPAYTSLVSCLEQDLLSGANALESQGGYIDLPSFEAGSSYMPFSSQLDFLGNPIPYWYYVSGNNIQKTQVPSKKDMEAQLGDFVERNVANCNFDGYYDEGFEINFGAPEAKVSISNNKINLKLTMDADFSKGNSTSLIRDHDVTVDSRMGSLYDSAVEVYNNEQDTLFLENYGIDVLRFYAPVDGVEIQCSPLVWQAGDILENLKQGVQENTQSLKAGSSYGSDSGTEGYFTINLPVDNEVRFLNSGNWPYSFEVNPSEDSGFLISKPVGNQAGLGILGFCYVPYHYVYDYKYPVLVQVFNKDNPEEIFQFPLAVIIQGNQPRESLNNSKALEVQDSGLCEQKNTDIDVSVRDSKLNYVNADISYGCFGSVCEIGSTSSGTLKGKFPQCVNGKIVARAEGYVDKEYPISTIYSGSVEIFLDKLYSVPINLKVDSLDYNGDAIISFSSDKEARVVSYPAQKSVELSQGQYEVQVYIYRNSSITLPETSSEQCVDVPSSGVGGFFGFTSQKCFTIDFPKQVVSNALAGGGKGEHFFLESELENNGVLEINSPSLPVPKTTDDLQNNYFSYDENKIGVNVV